MTLETETLEVEEQIVDQAEVDEALDDAHRTEIKKIAEALLISSGDPVPLEKLRDVIRSTFDITKSYLLEILQELRNEYDAQEMAFQLDELASGYVMRTREVYAPYVAALHHGKRADRVSHASLEVLSIIAYRQPITRQQVEEIRGVDSSGLIHTLLERQLIEPKGRLDVPGRPTLYGVTPKFLQHFGLKDISELPAFESSRPAVEEAEVVEKPQALNVEDCEEEAEEANEGHDEAEIIGAETVS